MPEILPSQLVTSLMARLYDVLTNGDDTVPASEDSFFSWATPGVPMSPEDFEFASRGLTGVVRRPPTPEGATPEPLTAADLEALRAQDAAGLYQQAEAFARLVDIAVRPSAATNDAFARLNILSTQGSLSDRYRYCLRMSQVLASDLEPEVKANIERLRGLLQTEVTKKDLIEGTETTVKESSELTKAYFEKMAAYEDAVLAYNQSRIAALAGTSAAAVQDFAINGAGRRNRVKAAMADWVNNGYKYDYEKIAAYIAQVSGRDMSLLKAEYLDDLEKAPPDRAGVRQRLLLHHPGAGQLRHVERLDEVHLHRWRCGVQHLLERQHPQVGHLGGRLVPGHLRGQGRGRGVLGTPRIHRHVQQRRRVGVVRDRPGPDHLPLVAHRLPGQQRLALRPLPARQPGPARQRRQDAPPTG